MAAAAKELACVPVYLEPHQRLGLARCEVIAGVTLLRLSGGLRRELERIEQAPRHFHANYVLLVDIDKYANGARQRIGEEGGQVPRDSPPDDWPGNPNRRWVAPTDLARQVLVSLILLQRFRFVLGGSYDLESERTGFRVRSYAPSPVQEVSLFSVRAISLSSRPVIDRTRLRRIALLLDPSYRGGVWQVDRMAVALSSLWAGICTPFLDQAFLSLTTVLEALLGGRGDEITHKLAERAAALMSRTRSQRPLHYRTVKHLYDIRSRIVHGNAHTKKGVVNWDSFHISAKRAIVPVTKLDDLGQVVNQVIHAVLSQPELLAIIQKRQHEEKTTQDLDNFFLHLTLS